MPFKLNISDKQGKSWKLELQDETLVGKSLGDTFDGKEVKPELEGYELKIVGGSDSAGFPLYEKLEGIGLKSILLTKGWGMRDSERGMRRKRTVRGKTIAASTAQINIVVVKAGKTALSEVFPDQNKPKEVAPVAQPAA